MNAVILSSCLLVLLVVVTSQSVTICGRYVCQDNQYCYSPYPARNRCYSYRSFGQTCYQSGLYLCRPGLKCVLVRGQRGVCRFETTTTTTTTSTGTQSSDATPVTTPDPSSSSSEETNDSAPTAAPTGGDF